MPNGGVPRRMVLRSTDSRVVIYAEGPRVAIYDANAWDAHRSSAEPLATLAPRESGALTSFLAYWLFDANIGEGPIPRARTGMEFDW